jgi:hypothetical protein
MTAPRKKKKRKSERPLEHIPLAKLIRSVKQDIRKELKSHKSKRD